MKFILFYFISFISFIISLKIDLISQPYDAYVDTSSSSSPSSSSRLLQLKENSFSSSTNIGRGGGGRRRSGYLQNQFVSPSNGTDILFRPIQLIKCENQTKCIQPELQLTKKFQVYYCK